MSYDFEIQYNSGLTNKAADALSRLPDTVALQIVVVPILIDVEVVHREVLEDPELQKIRKDLGPHVHLQILSGTRQAIL